LIAIRDAGGTHYLRLIGPEAARRPVVLIPPLGEFADVQAEILRRLHRRLSGKEGLPLPTSLDLTPLRRARLIQMLHALDLYMAGITPREIATMIVDRAAATMRAVEWKSSALRRRTMRLIEDARDLMQGSYRELLLGS
jgi:hypothetical protein